MKVSDTFIATSPILGSDEPPVVELINIDGPSPVVLVCDHASNRVPKRLGTLGLGEVHLADHIAWDPGAADVARLLSNRLDAPLVLSGYSRLVIDCNRPLGSVESIPEQSAGVPIPGNHRLSRLDKECRMNEFFKPYHGAIAQLLDSRTHRQSLLLSIHSFTPVLFDEPRPWHIGISHGHDRQLAARILGVLATAGNFIVGDNKPYPIGNGYDYTIPTHGDGRGLPSVMIEIRQDGIRSVAEAAVWAERLVGVYRQIEVDVYR